MTFSNNNKSQCLPCSHLWMSERADDSCPIINKSVLGWSNGYSFAFSKILSTICWLSFVLEALVCVDISPESLADSSLFLNRQLTFPTIGSPKRRVECTKCFQISIYIKLAPFLCHLSRAASTQLKSSVDIYRIYLRLATISQLTNIRLRQNAKYFVHVNKT